MCRPPLRGVDLYLIRAAMQLMGAALQLAGTMPYPQYTVPEVIASSGLVGATPLTGYVSRLVDRCFVLADICHQRLRCAALQLIGAAIQLTGSAPPPPGNRCRSLLGIFHKPLLSWQAPPSTERCHLSTDIVVLQMIGAATQLRDLVPQPMDAHSQWHTEESGHRDHGSPSCHAAIVTPTLANEKRQRHKRKTAQIFNTVTRTLISTYRQLSERYRSAADMCHL